MWTGLIPLGKDGKPIGNGADDQNRGGRRHTYFVGCDELPAQAVNAVPPQHAEEIKKRVYEIEELTDEIKERMHDLDEMRMRNLIARDTRVCDD